MRTTASVSRDWEADVFYLTHDQSVEPRQFGNEKATAIHTKEAVMSDGERDRKRQMTASAAAGVTKAESSDEYFERTVEGAVRQR